MSGSVRVNVAKMRAYHYGLPARWVKVSQMLQTTDDGRFVVRLPPQHGKSLAEMLDIASGHWPSEHTVDGRRVVICEGCRVDGSAGSFAPLFDVAHPPRLYREGW